MSGSAATIASSDPSLVRRLRRGRVALLVSAVLHLLAPVLLAEGGWGSSVAFVAWIPGLLGLAFVGAPLGYGTAVHMIIGFSLLLPFVGPINAVILAVRTGRILKGSEAEEAADAPFPDRWTLWLGIASLLLGVFSVAAVFSSGVVVAPVALFFAVAAQVAAWWAARPWSVAVKAGVVLAWASFFLIVMFWGPGLLAAPS